MRIIKKQTIVSAVERLCGEANIYLPDEVFDSIKRACVLERSGVCKHVLNQNVENALLAVKEKLPLCQDTGMAVFFVELGVDAKVEGDLYENINQGVRQGYKKYYLRASMLKDPLIRVNTKDNTPAFIHLKLVKGDSLVIHFMPKGGGAENLSRSTTLPPSAGVEGVKKFVIDTVEDAGATPCPPIVVGVGIGGNFETAPLLAKHALLRKIGTKHPQKYYRDLEKELLESINRLGIGAAGLGGEISALAVFIETHPCHISALPVAVNIQCHVCRHKTAIL